MESALFGKDKCLGNFDEAGQAAGFMRVLGADAPIVLGDKFLAEMSSIKCAGMI